MLIRSATSSLFAQAWRAFWSLRKRRAAGLWADILIAAGLAVLAWAALCLLGMAGVVTVTVPDASFLRRLLLGMLLLFLAIAWSMLAVARLLEALLPEPMLARLSPVRDWRAAALVSLILLAGLMLGNLLGSALLALAYPGSELFASSALRRQLRVLQFLPFLAIVAALFWRGRLQRQKMQAQAAEAQLRLLQAQIEPHFLFNTLANIESLLDADPPRARAMLEAFSDHLRAGMGQLRVDETTLGAELEMAANYLRLLQIRMGERLRFSVEAGPDARAALLPPLLLQPLVENAIRHGLEPKVAGGEVRIVAAVENGRLCVQVRDDGMGAEAPPAAKGAGSALDNIRARLRHRYGERASLRLMHGAGTDATIELPYKPKP
ncbi:histidine kinase [Massilia sp. YIM B02769]|uniref:sensor histidine kinase n=1 Tax=Massilia sp. YIM B02769 TaxID=3050129 RepID=UPI0025B64DE3|nr:histidine kinase [Massilia sp. YIM B02769]MDN4060541.1 histidine kinase [Massilia sp. YIM B02769]